MRSEQRLTRIEQQVQARFDQEIQALLPDLSKWTNEEIEAVIKAIEDAPHTPEEQAELDRISAMTPLELLGEHYAT